MANKLYRSRDPLDCGCLWWHCRIFWPRSKDCAYYLCIVYYDIWQWTDDLYHISHIYSQRVKALNVF